MLAVEQTTEDCSLVPLPEDSAPPKQLQLPPNRQSNLAAPAEEEADQEGEEVAEGSMLPEAQQTDFCSWRSLQSSLTSKHKVSIR